MQRFRSSWVLGLGLVLAACGPREPGPIHAGFTVQEAAWSLAEGVNNIAGKAVIALPNGDTHTCASYTVVAVPATPYATERMERIYGNAQLGQRDPNSPGAPVYPDYPSYRQSQRTTNCDIQGNFAFTGLPDGGWYIVAPIVWQDKLGEPFRGATFMKRVVVEGGRTFHITLGGE